MMEMQNTTKTLHCMVDGCDDWIGSVDAYKDHYIKRHENQMCSDKHFNPIFSDIRITDVLDIKRNKLKSKLDYHFTITPCFMPRLWYSRILICNVLYCYTEASSRWYGIVVILERIPSHLPGTS